MSADKYPVTPAIRALRDAHVEIEHHLYDYVEKGGTTVSAQALGVPEHSVIKTLIMEDEHKKPLIILMHGDKEVSTKQLARLLAVKQIKPCSPDTANKHSGYLVGGTSPFGTRKPMPVYMEESILQLPKIYLNGGKRGYLVSLNPQDVVRVLKPTLVNVAVDA
ncbi:ybaK/ebsC protein [Beggiatoa alba B18LD]|uniref:Cys-tRNA(Pro)/Cys-tRNA(Cys) deacylase n=1 Tax=Beggiatoa alba B18LD TaxID=395493 RepID=I3CBY2_9GAMM|nr:Cys-tRNA(Pro) deacylase [Beggiatoa alba]EIJ41125.1 ybaK/ebsC protein [Beggiatoa alba B18LD]